MVLSIGFYSVCKAHRYASGGELFDYIVARGRVPEPEAWDLWDSRVEVSVAAAVLHMLQLLCLFMRDLDC